MKTLAVIGSRGFDINQVDYWIGADLQGYERLVSGGARDVDQFSEEYAGRNGLSVVSYRPVRDVTSDKFVVQKYVDGMFICLVSHADEILRYDTFGDAAKARNWWIARDGDAMSAFWDGVSSGTAHGIAASIRNRRPVTIHMDGDS